MPWQWQCWAATAGEEDDPPPEKKLTPGDRKELVNIIEAFEEDLLEFVIFMEAIKYKENGSPTLVKELVAKIENTLLGLLLTLTTDVDSGRVMNDINNAKEVIKDAYAALNKAKRKAMRKPRGSQGRRKVKGTKHRQTDVVRQAVGRLANGLENLSFGSIRVSAS